MSKAFYRSLTVQPTSAVVSEFGTPKKGTSEPDPKYLRAIFKLVPNMFSAKGRRVRDVVPVPAPNFVQPGK
jgi:hypothetical protein